jgi:hypothetical protein
MQNLMLLGPACNVIYCDLRTSKFAFQTIKGMGFSEFETSWWQCVTISLIDVLDSIQRSTPFFEQHRRKDTSSDDEIK